MTARTSAGPHDSMDATTNWQALAARIGVPYPFPLISGGDGTGDGGAGGGDDKVDRAEFDRIKEAATKREKLLRDAQAKQAKLREEFTALVGALGVELPDDPDERAAALEQLAAERKKAANGKTLSQEEVQRALSDADKRWQKQIAERDTKLSRRDATLRTVLIKNAALTAALTAGATEGGAEALALMIANEADIIEDESGELVAVIKGTDGPRLNDRAERMTIAERVGELAKVEKYASFFKPTGAPGAGSNGGGPSTRGGAGQTKFTAAELNDPNRYAEYRKALDEGKNPQIVA